MTISSVALLGFGEVNQRLAADLQKAGITRLTAWDVKLADAGSIPSRAIAGTGVTAAASAVEAVAGADLVLSAVTAANDHAAALSVAPGIGKGAFYLDMNSASPGQKLESAAAIDGAGGRYVEAAVMSPIDPKRIASPMLLGGPHAADFLAQALPLGFAGCSVYADRIGPASATKMCRSVIIKGTESLLTESMLAARKWGVEQDVLASLSNLLPFGDWEKLAAYMISRSLEHGVRRAEEMREVAKTVAETGVEPLMSSATAARQDWSAQYRDALADPSLAGMIDAIRAKIDAS